MTIPSFLRIQSDGVLLSVKVQPRAPANEIGLRILDFPTSGVFLTQDFGLKPSGFGLADCKAASGLPDCAD